MTQVNIISSVDVSLSTFMTYFSIEVNKTNLFPYTIAIALATVGIFQVSISDYYGIKGFLKCYSQILCGGSAENFRLCLFCVNLVAN